jgi:hypothetical protein
MRVSNPYLPYAVSLEGCRDGRDWAWQGVGMRRAAAGKVPQCDVMREGKLSDYRSRRKHLPRCVILGVCKTQRPSHGNYAGGSSTTRGIFCRHARCASGGARHFLGKADSAALPGSSCWSAITCYTRDTRTHHKGTASFMRLQMKCYIYTQRRKLTPTSSRVIPVTTTLSCPLHMSCSSSLYRWLRKPARRVNA